ncbi:MAG: type II secretion system protein [Planctomycetes bacterium]|nr:type II secretion system protein [Planctomycetota bacterium]
MTQRWRAFTLIEILIVVTIIGVLIALLLPLLGVVKFRARVVQTTQRLEAVQSAILALGGQSGSTGYALQRDLVLGGTIDFELDTTTNQARPAGGAPWHACYPDAAASAPGQRLVMAYPWGKARQYWIREAWYSGPQGLPTTNPNDPAMSAADRDAWYAAWRAPERHELSEFWPLNTLQMLRLAGIMPGTTEAEAVAAYKDRSSSRTFNDAWGNPLVIAHAVYQPTRCQLGGTFSPDYYVREGLAQYQYNRSVYLSVAAVGPWLHPTVFPGNALANPSGFASYADWEPTVRQVWTHACLGTMTGGQAVWDETGFDRPPWNGARLGKLDVGGTRVQPLLMAPVEMK